MKSHIILEKIKDSVSIQGDNMVDKRLISLSEYSESSRYRQTITSCKSRSSF